MANRSSNTAAVPEAKGALVKKMIEQQERQMSGGSSGQY